MPRTKLDNPEVIAAKLAQVERTARLTLTAIVILTVAGLVAVVVLFSTGQSTGAAVVLTILTPTVTSLLSFRKSTENAAAIHEVHLSVNSRLSQLLDKTETSARAEGMAAGKAESQTE